MRIMFLMMNASRMDVGMQSLGHATAAYEHAVQYAKDRIQGVPVWDMKNPDAKAVPIIQHPDIRRKLLWMKAHVEGMRALLYFTWFCMDLEGYQQRQRRGRNGMDWFIFLHLFARHILRKKRS